MEELFDMFFLFVFLLFWVFHTCHLYSCYSAMWWHSQEAGLHSRCWTHHSGQGKQLHFLTRKYNYLITSHSIIIAENNLLMKNCLPVCRSTTKWQVVASSDPMTDTESGDTGTQQRKIRIINLTPDVTVRLTTSTFFSLTVCWGCCSKLSLLDIQEALWVNIYMWLGAKSSSTFLRHHRKKR